jgi:hypothetical protein
MRNVKTFSRTTHNWSIGSRNQVKVDVPEAEIRQNQNGSSCSSKDRSTTVPSVPPAKPNEATCDKCGLEIRPRSLLPNQKRDVQEMQRDRTLQAVCNAKAKMAAIYINQVSFPKDDTVTISIKARGEPATKIRTLPDTGSTLDAIPPSVYHRQFQDVPLDVGIHAETATGNHIKSLGSFQAQIDWKANDGSSRPIQSTVHVLET